jgi:excisionase family DNA binding protein
MTGSSAPRLEDLPDVIPVKTVATFFGCAENTCYSAIRSGALPAVRLGRRLLVPKSGLIRFLEGSAGTPEGR